MGKIEKVGAVIVAAGAGLRFGELKQLKKLGNQPLYLHSLNCFCNSEIIEEIVVVVPAEIVNHIIVDIKELRVSKLIKVVAGGKLRQDSVRSGVEQLSSDCEIVCIHDAARPFVTPKLISKTIEACQKCDGAIAALPANDTVKSVPIDDKMIAETIPRKTIWLAQTPQTFHRTPLMEALKKAKEDNIQGTDEAALLERLGYKVAVVEGNTKNIKITNPKDWGLAEILLEKQND